MIALETLANTTTLQNTTAEVRVPQELPKKLTPMKGMGALVGAAVLMYGAAKTGDYMGKVFFGTRDSMFYGERTKPTPAQKAINKIMDVGVKVYNAMGGNGFARW